MNSSAELRVQDALFCEVAQLGFSDVMRRVQGLRLRKCCRTLRPEITTLKAVLIAGAFFRYEDLVCITGHSFLPTLFLGGPPQTGRYICEELGPKLSATYYKKGLNPLNPKAYNT